MRALRPALVRYFRERKLPLAFSALLLAVPGLFSSPPPDASPDGLVSLLDQATGSHTAPADLAWEPRRGVFAELTAGRALLFLAAPSPGAARDLYRAWVRLTPGGQPLAVTHVERLTETPLADECGLLVEGTYAAFATISGERVRAVSVLGGLGGSTARALLGTLRSSASAPLERTDLLLETPATRASLSLDERRLKLELDQSGMELGYELERRALAEGSTGLRVLAREPGGASGRLALLDGLRRQFGEGSVALAGRVFYGAKDWLRFVTPGGGSPQEKTWQPLARAWLRLPSGIDREKGAPEPYFRRRVLRPDPARPAARVVLVGIDTRQLELAVQAGTAWPRASVSVPGDGRLPRGELARRVVGVFNAGPEAAYDRYGTMVEGRVLVPAVAGLPGLLLDTSRGALIERFAFGSAVPAGVFGFEQRRSALLDQGVFDGAAGDRSVRRRTALCTTRTGELLYAFADALDTATLARGLAEAGCSNAIPLAAGPERLGFALAELASTEAPRFELVDEAMDLDARSFTTGSSRDFFYLTVRDTQPKSPPGVPWVADGGAQPPPLWLPGILKAELTLGSLRVELLSVNPAGVSFRLRAGASEVGARGEPWVGVLDPGVKERALLTLDLGHATASTRYGLALGTLLPLPLKPAYATLVLGDGVPPRIFLPGEPVTLAVGEQAVQLPLLADDGDVTERARERGDSRLRSAVGVTGDGRLVIATLRHDSSDPLAVALRSAGCRRVLELDRGSHHPAALGRTGTAAPPPEDPKTTTLWVASKTFAN
jgi:hypothetical protein